MGIKEVIGRKKNVRNTNVGGFCILRTQSRTKQGLAEEGDSVAPDSFKSRESFTFSSFPRILVSSSIPLLVIGVFALMMAFFIYHTVWLPDDFFYSTFLTESICRNGIMPTDHPVPFKHVWEIVESQWNHYFFINGRAVAHTLVQLFCGFGGRGWFTTINTLMFCLLALLLAALGCGHKAVGQWKVVALSCCAVYIFLTETPTPCVSISYVWMGVLCLLFLGMYRRTAHATPWQGVGLCVMALLAGWSHESMTLGLAPALVVYAFVHRSSTHRMQWAMVAFFCLGVMMIVLCPATWDRVGRSVEKFSFITSTLRILIHLKAFYVMLVLMVYARVRNKRSVAALWKENELSLLAIGFLLLAWMMVGYENTRQLFGIELFATLVSLRLAVQTCMPEKNAVLVLVLMLCGLHVAGLLPLTLRVEQNFKRIQKQVMTSRTGIIYSDVPAIPRVYLSYCWRQEQIVPNLYYSQALSFLYSPERRPIVVLPMQVERIVKKQEALGPLGTVMINGDQAVVMLPRTAKERVEIEVTYSLWGKHLLTRREPLDRFIYADGTYTYYSMDDPVFDVISRKYEVVSK